MKKKIRHISSAWVLLLALTSILIVKDFHHFRISDCCEKHDQESHADDCGICHFILSPFITDKPVTPKVTVWNVPREYYCYENNIIRTTTDTPRLREPPFPIYFSF